MTGDAAGAPTGPREISGRIGKYEIVRPIGRGAMGVVYLAHDTVLERDVALKIMNAAVADDPHTHERFTREAKAVAKMTHPNVVTVFDLGTHTDGSPYIAMELLKGQDLLRAMRTPPPMPLDQKITVILQVLAGLAHAHQAGIVHRDIKPANIFINADGTVKIMDFGVARLTTGSMTGTGNIVGTADYMSPEQVKGARVDGRSDLFSVGCMLFELITSRRPFHAENLMAIFYKITHEEPDLDLLPKGPEYEALRPLLHKAMAKSLEERYQTPYEFAVDLREYLKQHSGARVLESLLEIEVAAPPGATLVRADESPSDPTQLVGRTEPGLPATSRQAATLKAPPRTPTESAALPTMYTPEARAAAAAAAPAPARTRDGQPTARALPATAPQRAGTPPGVSRAVVAPPRRGAGPLVVAGAGVLAVGVLVGGGYWLLKARPTAPVSEPIPPAVVSVSPPAASSPSLGSTTTAVGNTPLAQSVPPALKPQPPPTFPAGAGRGAAAVEKGVQAFNARDYISAKAQAEAALKHDPESQGARELLAQADNGLSAESRLRSSESALRRNDFAAALREAEEARTLAPWDSRPPELTVRVQEAQRRAEQAAQQEAAQQQRQRLSNQLNGVLGQAETALVDKRYDAAIELYDAALKLDPGNARAQQGRSGAVTARAIAQAAQNSGVGSGKRFVPNKTTAQSSETRASAPAPEGFEVTPNVKVQQGSQAGLLPGKILFDVDPEHVRPGDAYKVRIFLLNEGTSPILIRDMLIGTKVNGRGASGPLPPLAKEVAPQQRALLRELPDLWKEDTSSWTMEVTVNTARGETYRNQLTWR